MVCTAHLDDSLFLGSASCDTDSGHNGFGTAAEHTEFFYVRHIFVDFFGNEKFCLVEKTGNGTALFDELDSLFSNCWEVATQDGRTARLQKVYVFVAVDIFEVCALCLGHAHWERLVECKVVLHAARNILFGFGGDSLGLRALFVVIFSANLLISIFWNAIDILIGQFLETCVDFLRVRPTGNAVTGFLLTFEFGICYFHNNLLRNKITIIKILTHFAPLVNNHFYNNYYFRRKLLQCA